jgi:hypothetical protein
MCSSLTFLSHMNNIYFFLFVFFDGFRQENYVGMWGNYGFEIVGIFSGPLRGVSCSITNILWWYKHFFFGPICFFKELGFGGSIFVL